jgi:Antitoxin VbhA
MNTPTRWHLEQALASTRLEGHEPSPEFLADCEAMVTGQISIEEARERIIDRAREVDRRATAEPDLKVET